MRGFDSRAAKSTAVTNTRTWKVLTNRPWLTQFLVALLLFLVCVLVLATPTAFVLTLLAAFLVAYYWPARVLALLAVGALGFAVYRSRMPWSALAYVTVLTVLVACPSPRDSPANTLAQWVDFCYYRPRLDRMVEQRRAAGQHPLVAAVAISGFGSITNGLAFDESGEIARPAAQRSSAWGTITRGTPLDAPDMHAAPARGDYYWWTVY